MLLKMARSFVQITCNLFFYFLTLKPRTFVRIGLTTCCCSKLWDAVRCDNDDVVGEKLSCGVWMMCIACTVTSTSHVSYFVILGLLELSKNKYNISGIKFLFVIKSNPRSQNVGFFVHFISRNINCGYENPTNNVAYPWIPTFLTWLTHTYPHF